MYISEWEVCVVKGITSVNTHNSDTSRGLRCPGRIICICVYV